MSTKPILAIETSCDETAVAVVQKRGDDVAVLAEAVASQVDVHALTGGVVPNVAAREHAAILPSLIKSVVEKSGVAKEDLGAIAVTVGPGLQPALAVGVNAARTLSFALNKPLIPVHHIEGHIYSALLLGEPLFPALALIVSGGHTQLILITNHVQYELLGSTRDDAAGEAFDKVARLLGLPYPGGPHLSRLAATGNRAAFSFTRPMLHSGDLDFSFSGLKTEVLYLWRSLSAAEQEQRKADIAASFEQCVVDTVVAKTKQAVATVWPKIILLAGGVAANSRLRETLTRMAEVAGVPLRIAPQALCGDNAVMIGQAATYAWERGRTINWREIDAEARPSLARFSQSGPDAR
ncbi:MAG: tRNA (adenosine(37)-N6)-threonylcarbamoyltransferase complex transferase subunit TsaD [Candidatus Andersenbacteria bacterium]